MTKGHDLLFRYLFDEDRKARLVHLRSVVTRILANNLLPHFTDHSVSHADNLTHLVDELIAPLQTREDGRALSADELFVLYVACYLHDIGMQYENAGQTQTVQSRMTEWGLVTRWEELDEATRRDLLRECHPEISAEMVTRSVRNAYPPLGVQLTDQDLPEYIARLCHAHAVHAPSEFYDELTADGPDLRMKLLSAVLRLADILEESRRRALREKARSLQLDLIAQMHWWRHYYTEDVTFDLAHRTVTIHFDFPPRRRDEYARIVPQLQIPAIEEEFRRHQGVLNQYGCGWTIQTQIQSRRYGTAEEMPDAVAMAMIQQLQQAREQQAAEQQIALFEAFSEARELMQRRLEALHTDQSSLPENRLRKAYAMAREFWQLKARRSAWMLLRGEYELHASALPSAERLQIGCDLARLMLEDGEATKAARVLPELQPLADASETIISLRRDFWELWARCRSACAAYEEAVAALQTLIGLTEPDGRDECQVLLAEEHYLHGELEQAHRVAEGAEEAG